MKRGLGRGLDALFSIYEDEEDESINAEEEKPVSRETQIEKKKVEVQKEKVEPLNNELQLNEGVREIDIRKIDPNRNQPRKKFDSNSLKELAQSINTYGIIQPIIVNKGIGDRYVIIAGERRFRASLIAGKTTIPAIVKSYTDREVKEVSLIENLQREDLNPIEAAKAIRELMDSFNFTQENVADRIGKSRPLVANTLRLLSLDPQVINLIETNQLSAGHGKCLVAIADKQKQIEIANFAVANKLTVRDLEKLIRNLANSKQALAEKQKIVQSIELKELGHRIQRLFRTKVAIHGNDKKGNISIAYFNSDDLDRICSFIDKLERL